MGSRIFWILTLRIREDKKRGLEQLMTDMITATQNNEPGALQYEWFVNNDINECQIHELYEDDAAVLEHLKNFAAFAERFMTILEPVGFDLYGNAGDEVRSALNDLNPTYHLRAKGFVR